MKMVMQYGDVQKGPMAPQGLELLDAGTVLDDTTVELTFEPGGMYALFCGEFNISTGAYRGQRAFLLQAPQDSFFGTVSVHQGTLYSSSNSGVNISTPSDSTLTIKQSSSIYGFRYALYKVL